MSRPHSTGSVPTERPVLHQTWGPNYHEALSTIPMPRERAEHLLCPILTLHNKSIEELTCKDVPEIRAYKLGKKRWSYNQFEIRVQNEIGAAHYDVQEALQSSTPPSLQHLSDACASYKVRLQNGLSIIIHAFMVYEHALDIIVREGESQKVFYQWVCVDRSGCKKGCVGPVLRPIQRFGRVGKRSGPEAPKNQAGQLKNYKYMYLSMDEAGTHVGGNRFRMLFCAYDDTGSTMLGTTISIPIKVLANNDVPTGAAHVPINITLRSDWIGWYNMSPCMLAKTMSNMQQMMMRDEDSDMAGSGPFGPRYVPNPEPLNENMMAFEDEAEDDGVDGCKGCGNHEDRPGSLFNDLTNFGEGYTDAEQLKVEEEEHIRIVKEMGFGGADDVGDIMQQLVCGGADEKQHAGVVSPEVPAKRVGKMALLSPGNSSFSSHTNNDHGGYPSPLGPPVLGKRQQDHLMAVAPKRIATRPAAKRQRLTVHVHAGIPDLRLPRLLAVEGAPGPLGPDVRGHLIEHGHDAPWAPAPLGHMTAPLERTSTATSTGLLLPTETPTWRSYSPGLAKLQFDGELSHTPLQGSLSAAAEQLMSHMPELHDQTDPLGEFGSPRERLHSLFDTPRAGLTPRGFDQIFQSLPASHQ